MRPTLALLAACFAVGCVDAGTESEPTAPNQLRGDDKSDDSSPLWAGLTSVTIERYASDPCNDGRNALGDAPLEYGDWARQRATVRNICFEVWSPGVTDWDNPDYWQQLDVQVHYRYGSTGEFQWKHVNSIDRRGNNRRYAFALEFSLDPTVYAASVAAIKAPIEILSESGEWARVAANLELYFTVNGRVLNAPSNKPFTVRYTNYARIPHLAPNPNGFVLHDIVTCGNGAARFGSGAGYFVADIRDAAAIATLGAGINGSWIYGAPTALSAPDLLSFTYSSQMPSTGEALPGFGDHGSVKITPSGSTMRVEMPIYDRALGRSRQVSHTFTGCAATN